MIEPLPEELDDMVVIQHVENHSPCPARSNKAHAAQQAKLMGDGGLGQAQERRQVTDAELGLRQRIQHPNAGHIAEHFEGFRKGRDRARADEAPAQLRDVRGIDLRELAVGWLMTGRTD